MASDERSAPPADDGKPFFEWVRAHCGFEWGPGLTDDEIAAAEAKWRVRFPPDYRLFLRVLHAPRDPARPSYFYNWTERDEVLQSAFDWPLEGLLFDVEHDDLWIEDWGARPRDQTEAKAKLRAAMATNDAKLIPIFGHRYLVGEPCRAGNAVLSIYQSDVIVYGTNLRDYLLNELFGMRHDGGDTFDSLQRATAIPFWGDLL